MTQILGTVRMILEQNTEEWGWEGERMGVGVGKKEKENNAIQDKDGESQPDRGEILELKLAGR